MASPAESSNYIISGIQQIGIGVPNVHEGFAWYRKNFGMDIPVFEEAAEANLMLPYTGGKPHKRHAILAINLKGGGGFEIWQYTSRTPQPSAFKLQLGDIGMFCAKMKTDNIEKCRTMLLQSKPGVITDICTTPYGKKHFYVTDLYGNLFEVIEDDYWFSKGPSNTGGPIGVVIGVSDVVKAKRFYGNVLGYNKVLFEETGVFRDYEGIAGANEICTRVVLTHQEPRKGPFARLFGNSYIELVQTHNYMGKKIFENRFWGDLGFIHLCFDIKNMHALKTACENEGHPFTVDGGAGFEMGEAAGHFTYIEDPDGTLIEFVETKKIPVLKKLGWYLDLKKRDPEKPLPDWMLKSMRFNRVKD